MIYQMQQRQEEAISEKRDVFSYQTDRYLWSYMRTYGYSKRKRLNQRNVSQITIGYLHVKLLRGGRRLQPTY